MQGFKPIKVKRIDKKHQEKSNEEKISSDYQVNIDFFKSTFANIDLIQYHELVAEAEQFRCCLIYCDGMVNSEVIDAHIIKPLLEVSVPPEEHKTADFLLTQVVQMNGAKKLDMYEDIVQGIMYGETVLIVENIDEALLFDTKKFETRSVMEPEGEKILSGPREGFTELMMMNLSMVRRRLRTDTLKMSFRSIGRRTHTQICVAYMDGIVNQKILQELYRRLDTIDIDGVLDANYINELVRDDAWSPFRSIGYTERPDIVAGKLLEGRIAIFVDGTPVVLTLPYLFIENFQSNEDYYLNFYYTSFSRMLRILGFFITIMLPAIYIAVVGYHHEMLPAPLLISIATERQGVPLPAALEAFIMLIVFDILRETGLRMPTNVGQALSIVGALVVGQAAVEARLVAAPMIIIVAMTGITSLLVPKMNAPVIFLRFGMLALASSLGFLGVTLGFALMLTHILGLQSFGISQITPDDKLHYQEIKDTVIRAPWWQMRLRPVDIATDKVREKVGERDK